MGIENWLFGSGNYRFSWFFICGFDFFRYRIVGYDLIGFYYYYGGLWEF